MTWLTSIIKIMGISDRFVLILWELHKFVASFWMDLVFLWGNLFRFWNWRMKKAKFVGWEDKTNWSMGIGERYSHVGMEFPGVLFSQSTHKGRRVANWHVWLAEFRFEADGWGKNNYARQIVVNLGGKWPQSEGINWIKGQCHHLLMLLIVWIKAES